MTGYSLVSAEKKGEKTQAMWIESLIFYCSRDLLEMHSMNMLRQMNVVSYLAAHEAAAATDTGAQKKGETWTQLSAGACECDLASAKESIRVAFVDFDDTLYPTYTTEIAPVCKVGLKLEGYGESMVNNVLNPLAKHYDFVFIVSNASLQKWLIPRFWDDSMIDMSTFREFTEKKNVLFASAAEFVSRSSLQGFDQAHTSNDWWKYYLMRYLLTAIKKCNKNLKSMQVLSLGDKAWDLTCAKEAAKSVSCQQFVGVAFKPRPDIMALTTEHFAFRSNVETIVAATSEESYFDLSKCGFDFDFFAQQKLTAQASNPFLQ